MLSASWRQPHLLHVSAVDRRQIWSMDESWRCVILSGFLHSHIIRCQWNPIYHLFIATHYVAAMTILTEVVSTRQIHPVSRTWLSFCNNASNFLTGLPYTSLWNNGKLSYCLGVAQCAELCWQLRGLAGRRQVKGARVSLQHNIGLGGVCVVTMYRHGFPDAASWVLNSLAFCLPHAGSGLIDPLHFLAGCRTRWLDQV